MINSLSITSSKCAAHSRNQTILRKFLFTIRQSRQASRASLLIIDKNVEEVFRNAITCAALVELICVD